MTVRYPRALAAIAGVMLIVSTDAGAQSTRSFAASRTRRDSAPMLVRVNYDAGHLDLRSKPGPALYDVHLRYDASASSPLYDYSTETRALRIGSNKLPGNFRGPKTHGDDSLDVALTRAAPVDLSIELGAVGADVDLTGLRLSHLKLASGASDATLRFDSANTERMSIVELQAGVAKLRVTGLANANADEVRVRAGVGSVDLDFSGAWRHDSELTLDVALGAVTLHVPAGVGVRMELSKTLTKVEVTDMPEQGGVWQSTNWSTAPRKLLVRAHTSLGSIRIERP